VILERLLEFQPDHPIFLYNLACAESLLKNGERALKVLQQAVHHGYSNLSHLQKDPDFDNIRETPQFSAIVNSLQEKLQQKQQPEKQQKQQPEAPHQKEEEEEEEEETSTTRKNSFQEELRVLAEMGFSNTPQLVSLLQTAHGDVSLVVSSLFSQ